MSSQTGKPIWLATDSLAVTHCKETTLKALVPIVAVGFKIVTDDNLELKKA